MGQWKDLDEETGKVGGIDYPCIVIGFSQMSDTCIAVVSWWHPEIEQHVKGFERAEMEKTLERLGKQLSVVFLRGFDSFKAEGTKRAD